MAFERAAPQVTASGANAPLSALAGQALRRYGDGSTRRFSGDSALQMIEIANRVVDEYNSHPYTQTLDRVDYYVDIEERRPIHDMILVAGLCAYYASQQGSAKAGGLMQEYYRTLNQKTYDAFAGRNPTLSLQVVEPSRTT